MVYEASGGKLDAFRFSDKEIDQGADEMCKEMTRTQINFSVSLSPLFVIA